MNKIVFDCERMKYPFTGLYYYCLHLKKNLEAINSDKELCYYVREVNKNLFQDDCILNQHSLHKFFFPSVKDYSVWHSTYQGTMYYPWKQKIKILFVCTVNRMRSATAHKIFETDERFEVKSAGTDKTANTIFDKRASELGGHNCCNGKDT